MRACSQSLFDVMTEISESARLAEEYHRKVMECSARIESCVGQVHDLIAKLSMCNTQFASSAEQSLGVVRSSVGSLMAAESNSRPTDSVGTAVREVEQLKAEQLQLCRRYDRLLAIFQMCARRMEQNDDVAQFQQQNFEDDTSVLHVPDRSGPVADQRMTLGADNSTTTVVRSLAAAAAGGQPSAISDNGAMVSDALDTAVSDSSSTHYVSRSRNRRGRRPASAGAVGRAAVGIGGRTSDSGSRTSSTMVILSSSSHRGTDNSASPAQPASSLDHEVVAARTEFKSPRGHPQGRPRGSRRMNQYGTAIRAHSSDTLPSDVSVSASSSGTDIVKPRRGRRSISAAPSRDAGNNAATVRLDNGDNMICSNSADDSVQSALLSDPSRAAGSDESAVVKARGRRRTKSAAQGTVTSSEKASDGQMDGKVISGRGRSLQRRRVTANVDSVDVTDSAQPRYTSPHAQLSARRRKNQSGLAEVIQSPTATTTTSVDATDALPSTSTTDIPSPTHRSVTTWLSGRRTDIFGQQSTASATQTSSAVLQSVNTDDDEVSFRPGVAVNTAMPVSATRSVVSYLLYELLLNQRNTSSTIDVM